MTFFLFKPHVEGPKGDITSPDIMIDRVFVDGELGSVNLLTDTIYHHTISSKAKPAFAITALGGGALIAPVVVLDSGLICLARKAWRLNNLEGHLASVSLNGEPLETLAKPNKIIATAGGEGDAMPRGYMLICTTSNESMTCELFDSVLNRNLSHKVIAEFPFKDRWGELRPNARYSVGPTNEKVHHYI